MSQLHLMLLAIGPVFGLIGIGAAVRRVRWLTAEADQTLMSLTVRLLMPCFIIREINRADWFNHVGDLLVPPSIGLALTTFGFATAAGAVYLFGRRIGLVTPAQKRTFVLCAGIPNYGFVPIPLVAQLFASDGRTMPTLLLHNVGVDIALWTIGLTILVGRLGRRWWAGLLNPVVIAIVLAVTLKLTGAWPRVDDVTKRMVSLLADCSIPLSLLLTGATISDVWSTARLRDGWGTMSVGVLVRLAILPTVFLLVGWLLRRDISLARVIVIEGAMPAAVFPIVLARHFGGDATVAVRIVIATSALAILTTPLWLLLGLSVIGR